MNQLFYLIIVALKSLWVKLMFDISNELSTRTIKRLYIYKVYPFFNLHI